MQKGETGKGASPNSRLHAYIVLPVSCEGTGTEIHAYTGVAYFTVGLFGLGLACLPS